MVEKTQNTLADKLAILDKMDGIVDYTHIIERVCKKCGSTKTLSEYFKQGKRQGDLRSYACKKCTYERQRETNLRTGYKQDRTYTKTPEYRAKMREKSRTPLGRLNSYLGSAKDRELVWSLTKDQFMSFWQKPCNYCGDPILTIGLDRIDSDLGYTMDNVCPCCTPCNMAKMNMTVEQYVAHCKKVIRHTKKQENKNDKRN